MRLNKKYREYTECTLVASCAYDVDDAMEFRRSSNWKECLEFWEKYLTKNGFRFGLLPESSPTRWGYT